MSDPSSTDLPPELRAILDFVRHDLSHGANDLTTLCLQKIQHVMLTQDTVSKQSLLTLLTELMQCRSSMVPLKNSLGQLRRMLTLPSDADFKRHAVSVLNNLHNDVQQRQQKVACYGAELIADGATIMSISRSSAVTAAFIEAHHSGKTFSVIQLASAPGNEGYIVARELNQLQISTQLITDAQAGLFIKQADIVIVGCDSWLADQYLVNKAGTYPLALLAKAHAKPFWVLADTCKNSDQGHQQVILEEMDPEEVGAPSGDYIRTRNIYFEVVPCTLVTGRVTEAGFIKNLCSSA